MPKRSAKKAKRKPSALFADDDVRPAQQAPVTRTPGCPHGVDAQGRPRTMPPAEAAALISAAGTSPGGPVDPAGTSPGDDQADGQADDEAGRWIAPDRPKTDPARKPGDDGSAAEVSRETSTDRQASAPQPGELADVPAGVTLARRPPRLDIKKLAHGEYVTWPTFDGREISANVAAIKATLPGASLMSTYELAAFLAFCTQNGLDPYRRQCYPVKYKADEPAVWITAYQVDIDRAQRSGLLEYFDQGVVWRIAGQAEPIYGRPCDYVADDDHQVVGGWARVKRRDWAEPFLEVVPLDEAQQRKKSGELNKFWRSMPMTMIQKVPLARALRKVLPDILGGSISDAEPLIGSPAYTPAGVDRPTREDLAGGVEPGVRVVRAIAAKASVSTPEAADWCFRMAAEITGREPIDFADTSSWSEDLADQVIARYDDAAAKGAIDWGA